MRKFLLLALLPLMLVAGKATAQSSPLVTPSELKDLLGRNDVVVVDVRDGKTPDGRTLYDAGHVPGAVSSPYSHWRSTSKENPGALPPIEQITGAIRKAGLAPDTHAIIVSTGSDTTDFGAAARVYWTLKVAGLQNLSILNGGYKAWTDVGLPTSTDPVKARESRYEPVIDRSLIATREEVAADDPSQVRLVDARPKIFFDGETRHQAATVPGTIAGASNFDNARWFKPGTATFVSSKEARRLADEAGLDGDSPAVCFCNTGHWAATNWFALHEILGEKNVKLYPGSMVEWSRSGLPMANVPNRAQQLLVDARLWWQRTFH